MTTRKTIHRRWLTFVIVADLSAVVLGGGGCATPGALHVYSVAPSAATVVHDAGGAVAAEVPSFIAPEEQLTGFAYDPFTDHFFLRLAPGNRLRVVDRPARAIKREFEIEGAPASGGGDLTVKPASGHIFLLHPTEPAVIEVTRLAKLVRTFSLAGLTRPAAGIAYDAKRDQLWILQRGERPELFRHDLKGERIGRGPILERDVEGSLAFDAEADEFYAPLAGAAREIGIFDVAGKLVRTLPAPAAVVDVGPRSFIRVF